MDYGWKGVLKFKYDNPDYNVLRKRETNKDDLEELVQIVDFNGQDTQFIKEFKKLRGDHGVKKTLADEYKETCVERMKDYFKNRKRPEDTSHLMFVSEKQRYGT